MVTEPLTEEAHIKAAYFAAARLVWAELGGDRAAPEGQAAWDDLWTGDEPEDARRSELLIEALVEYAAILARKASLSKRQARDAAYAQVWAMVPDEAAARDLARRALTAADEMVAKLEQEQD